MRRRRPGRRARHLLRRRPGRRAAGRLRRLLLGGWLVGRWRRVLHLLDLNVVVLRAVLWKPC
eukprot:13053192-Alexandrium_andersonii.AAC.1